ncbi:MAG: PAS domain S-box protein, partial [Bacteroidota bacterium]
MKSPNKRYKILIADNQDYYLKKAESRLSEKGIDVNGVKTGYEALQKLRKEEFSAMVISYHLPDISAEFFYDELEKHEINIPLIIAASPDKIIEATDLLFKGAEDIITKDKNFSEILILRLEYLARKIDKISENRLLAKRFSSLLSLVSNPVMIVTEKGSLVSVSDSFKDFFDHSNLTAVSDIMPDFKKIITEMNIDEGSYRADLLFNLGGEDIYIDTEINSYGDNNKEFIVSLYPENETGMMESPRVDSESDIMASVTLDAHGRIINANALFVKLSGYSSKELQGSYFRKLLTLELQEDFSEIFEIYKKNGFVQNVHFGMLKKDGSSISASVTARAFRDSYGNITQIRCLFDDVSGLTEVIKALKENETRYKELFKNMSSGVAVYDAINNGSDYVLKDFNRAGERIENLKKETIKGRTLSSIIAPDKHPDFYNSLKEVWLEGEPRRVECAFYDNEGIKGWRENYFYKLPSGELVAIFDDITDRINRNAALIESEERYRSFVQNFKGIAIRWTLDKMPVFVHGSVESITGFNENDFMERLINWNALIHKEDIDRVKGRYDLIKREPGYEFETEYRIITKNNNVRWVNEYIQNISLQGGKPLFVQSTIYDITERKNADAELKKSREQLRNLAIHLETAREEERKRIAFEIHDELGHALTSMKMELNVLSKKKFLKEEVISDKLMSVTKIVDSTIKQVRRISSQLRPSILDHFGLVAALEWQAKEFQKVTAIRVR